MKLILIQPSCYQKLDVPTTGPNRPTWKVLNTHQTPSTWNDLQNKLEINLLEKSNSKIKTALVNFYFINYYLTRET